MNKFIKSGLVFLIFFVILVVAYSTQTVYNPFTGKLDYILDAGSIDDTHTHGASNITNGTFASGNYTFQNGLKIAGNLTISNDTTTVGGLIHWNGSHTIIT